MTLHLHLGLMEVLSSLRVFVLPLDSQEILVALILEILIIHNHLLIEVTFPRLIPLFSLQNRINSYFAICLFQS